MRPRQPTFSHRALAQRSIALGSAQGRVRGVNEDRVLVATFDGTYPHESFECYAICDGMGGMQDGAQCASTALGELVAHLLRTRRRRIDPQSRLISAVEVANKAIYDKYRGRGGTTIAALLLTELHSVAVAVGDTRIYLHEHDGAFSQLSIDDTLASRMAEIRGEPLQGPSDGPFSNHLAQFVGQSGPTSPQTIRLPLGLFDYRKNSNNLPKGLLITSDGIHRMNKDVFSGVLKIADSPRDTVARLLLISEWTGGIDNESALYVGPRQSGPRTPVPQAVAGIPVLRLHDASADYEAIFALPEELDDTGSQREPLSPSFERGGSRERSVQADRGPFSRRSEQTPDNTSRSPTRVEDSNLAFGKGPKTEDEVASGSVTAVHLTPVAPESDAERRPEDGSDQAGKRKTRSGKQQKKTTRVRKGKGSKDERNGQSELDILISHESE